MRLFDFAAALTETVFDEVSGNKKRRHDRWIAESKRTAADVRLELTRDAYEIWVQKNRPERNALKKELKHYSALSNSLSNIKHSLEGTQVQAASKNQKSQENLKSPKFDDLLSQSPFTEKVKKEFPFEGAILYRGEKDDFINHLDAFMRKELEAHPKLLAKWATRVNEAKSIKK